MTTMLALLVATTVYAAPTSPAASDSSLLASLRAGGFVVACRHAITEDGADVPQGSWREPREKQRNLSAAGVAQARRLGAVLDSLGIRIAELRSSPFARTAETASLAFGRAPQIDHGLMSDESKERFPMLLASAPRPGTNTLLVTHQGVLYGTFTQFRRGEIAEGDCLIVRPEGERRHTFVRKVSPEGWVALR